MHTSATRGRIGMWGRFTLSTTLLLLVPKAANAVPSDQVFTVANYPVEARADNAVAAKDRALSEGQQAAFRSLLKRLVPVTAFPRLRQLAAFKAGDLVEGVKVRSERNSTTEYIANLDFSFQSKGIRDLLRREGIPFTDEQAPLLTLVPVAQSTAASAPKDDPAWTSTWKGLDLDHALTPVKLEVLRTSINPGSVSALAGGDGGAIRAFAGEYKSEHIVVVFAEPDPAAGRLNVTMTGRDAVGAFTLKRAFRLDAADPAYSRELAAVVLLGVLQGRWKAIKSGGGRVAGADTELLVVVEFRGMDEWQDISRKLSAIQGVEELEVAGLSARGARVTLHYAEGAARLSDVLARQGLALRNESGSWTLRLR